jgi:cell wall-associated NlpC family hydrolase
MLATRPTHSRSRIAALCVGALVATGLAVAAGDGANAEPFPGQDEIAAAREAAASQAATVADLDATFAALEEALHDAEAAQLLAADQYAQAQADLESSKAALVTAKQRAAEAEAALKEAQALLATVAQAAYREGGDMGQLGAVVTADGFEDAISSSELLSRASDEIATTVQRVEAAQLVADTMRQAADDAAGTAAAAEASAATSYDAATAAADAAEQAVRDAEAIRADAVHRLAEMRGTTVALEQERQQGLAEKRAQEKRDEAKEAQEEAEESQGTGGSSPKPEQTTEPKPKPTETSTPKPEETTEPKPEETEQPKPPTTSTGWKSTAAQGETASAKALTLIGLPYKLGGTGPASYDCSGLTLTAWKAAGISIQRSSQMQYNSTKHVAFSQLRKGDLIFYGTDRDPSKIYHVAIYVGGGMVAEATKPGSLSVVRAYDAFWRIDDLIPVAGRP